MFDSLWSSLEVRVLEIWCQTWVTLISGLALSRSFPWMPGLRSDVRWIPLHMHSNVNCRERTSGVWSGCVCLSLEVGQSRCACLLVTPQAIDVCVALASSTSLWGCTPEVEAEGRGFILTQHWDLHVRRGWGLKQLQGEPSWTSNRSVQCQPQVKNDPHRHS